MKIGILTASIYMYQKKYAKRIYAPGELAIGLADTLVDQGEDVFFFTAPDVQSKARIISGDKDLLEGRLHIERQQDFSPEMNDVVSLYETKKYYEIGLTTKAYQFARENQLDILHVYSGLGFLAHYFVDIFKIPTVYTLHTPPPPAGALENWRYQKFHQQNYISISKSQAKGFRDQISNINIVETIYHGLDLSSYSFNPEAYDYFAFIGRMIPEKGMDLAIRLAIKADVKLKIASSIDPAIEGTKYYQEKVLPFKHNSHVSFEGLLQDSQKKDFLKNARALLFPIQWEEPFGMVLIEAMAQGTPVIAFNRGSVSEIVVDGKTGFVVDVKKGINGLLMAMGKLRSLSSQEYTKMRQNCRKHVEEHFSSSIMAKNHLALYSYICTSNVK